jgi:uncharacterized protein (DUF362 family)
MLVTILSLATAAHGADSPLVSVCGSNDPALEKPAALSDILDYKQVRDVVWLALDRDTSSGCLRSIVKKDSWVVLKPNIVTANIPTMNDFNAEDVLHWGLVTDLRVIKAVAEYLIEKIGPKRVTIAEGGVWPSRSDKCPLDGWNCTWEAFDNLSYEGIVRELNAQGTPTRLDIVDFENDEGVYVTDLDPMRSGVKSWQDVAPGNPDGSSKDAWTKRKGYWIAKTALDCDVLVSVPVMKTHSSAGTTLALKNLMGCLSNRSYGITRSKAPLHQGSQLGLLRGIADLACAIRPDYAVVEGFWATEHQHLGQNGVNLNHNVVVAGHDVVAVEAISQTVMGFNPLDSDLLRMLNRKGMGLSNPDSIAISGGPVKAVARNFIRAANTYSARGLRKWLMAGPFEKPEGKPEGLSPARGSSLSGKEWGLLDGDAMIDSGVNSAPYSYQQCLLYAIPGSENAREGDSYYLAVRLVTPRKDLCGQLLLGVEGAAARAFFNGHEVTLVREALTYNPTPMPFLKFREGENLLVLELKKRDRNGPVKIAANVCDLDGDRLYGFTLDPRGE